MTIPNNIAKLRTIHNLNKEQFCEMVGITRRTLERWESGQRTPEIRYIKVIADKFCIADLYEFLFSSKFEKSVALTPVKRIKRKPPKRRVKPVQVVEKPKEIVIPKLMYI